MAGKQRAGLEQRARGLLAAAGHENPWVEDPSMLRPGSARLEIVHPRVADLGPHRGRLLASLADRDDERLPGLMLELAEMTRVLREGGMRATADHRAGCVVVGWGRQPAADLGQIRRQVAAEFGDDADPAQIEAGALIRWAASPASETDALSGGLAAAAQAISAGRGPGPRRPAARGAAGDQPGGRGRHAGG